VLIEAAKQNIEVPVRIAGDGSAASELLALSPPNVRFEGHLNPIQLANFYQNARFVVVPSICFESFGLVAAEAMSYGLPVIASKIGGLQEIVEDGVTGLLFEPRNSEELARKMNLLWNNLDLCQEMGQAGRRKVLWEFNEDLYCRKLMTVYETAIGLHDEKRGG
jgi:glycosyltransferase involved in cell wall biosynthesis